MIFNSNTKSNKKPKSWINTRNPCNQFIVKHLLEARKKAQQRNNDKKFFVYCSAMQSIKRYPLPIICKTQLRNLNGIGDVLCEQISTVIKNYYKSFLNQKAQQPNDFDSMKQQVSSQNRFAVNSNDQKMEQNSDLSASSQQNQIRVKREDGAHRTNLVSIGQTKSAKSFAPKIFKPKANTQAGFILMSLVRMSEQNLFFSKQTIKQYIFSNYQSTLKDWKTVVNLSKHQYVQISIQNKNQIRLTAQGRLMGESLLKKVYHSKSKVSIQHQIKQLKQVATVVNQQKKQIKQFVKEPINYESQDDYKKLVLIVDCREIKDRSDRDFFYEKLLNKYNINCKTGNISIGDFIWTYDGKVLDYVIQRKNADDLASSIMDGRYKQQKYRLSVSGVSNIFYLYEGHPSSNSVKGQKQLSNALLKTRMQQCFKVIKTKDINQSIKFLDFMHSVLCNKIRQKSQLFLIGTLQQFNKRNSKQGSLTIEQIFGLGLRSFPGVGIRSTQQLIKYFKSYKLMHQKLKTKINNEQRIIFLSELLRGTRVSKNLPRLLVQFFFNKSYDGIN